MKIYAIAKLTFLQVIRQPIYGVLLLVAMGLMVLAPSITGFTLETETDTKMLQDLCLSTILLTGLVLAAFSAAGAISAEIEDQTILTVVSKPVNRLAFVAGKYLGVMTALLLAVTFLTLTFILVLRHGVLSAAYNQRDVPVLTFGLGAAVAAIILAGAWNYLFDWQFGPTAMALGLPLLSFAVFISGWFTKDWKFQSWGKGYSMDVVAGCVLLLLAVWVLAGVCLVCSTRLNVVWSLVIAFIVLLLGMVWDYYVLPHALPQDPGSVKPFAKVLWCVLYAVVPNFQVFWMLDALNEGKTIGLWYILSATGYAATYILASLFLAFALFLERQVGVAHKY